MRASSVEQIILETLNTEDAHLTSLQVYEEIRRRLPAVNPSTVYRALERLTNSGKVSVSDIGTGSVVYERLADGFHHHLVCKECGRVQTIKHELVGTFFTQIQQLYDFQVMTNHLILFGVCLVCMDRRDQ